MADRKKDGYDERIEKLKEKQLRLKEREKSLRAKKKAAEREKRSLSMLKAGRAVYSVLGRDFVEGDIERLTVYLTERDERSGDFSRTMNNFPDSSDTGADVETGVEK